MGYNFSIGELVILGPHGDIGEMLQMMFGVYAITKGKKIGAPLNSSDTYCNSIYPSYTAWSNFCHRTNLYDVFFSDNHGLINEHPGASLLGDNHLELFEFARNNYNENISIDEYLYDKRRLNWLYFWTKWAIDNCKKPVFVNS